MLPLGLACGAPLAAWCPAVAHETRRLGEAPLTATNFASRRSSPTVMRERRAGRTPGQPGEDDEFEEWGRMQASVTEAQERLDRRLGSNFFQNRAIPTTQGCC